MSVLKQISGAPYEHRDMFSLLKYSSQCASSGSGWGQNPFHNNLLSSTIQRSQVNTVMGGKIEKEFWTERV